MMMLIKGKARYEKRFERDVSNINKVLTVVFDFQMVFPLCPLRHPLCPLWFRISFFTTKGTKGFTKGSKDLSNIDYSG